MEGSVSRRLSADAGRVFPERNPGIQALENAKFFLSLFKQFKLLEQG